VTIDPAERLAAALGLRELSHEPRRIDGALFEAHGVPMRGEMWAMMLDVKRTLDEAVAYLAPEQTEREEILENRIYRELSSAVAGSQELSAIVKLYELHHERDFDVVVLDTPPSRNALDFLDAPNRMLRFLEGRALKVFLAPGGLTARLLGRSTGLVFSVFARMTGVDMLSDLSTFFRSMSGVLDGFGQRTREVAALLRDPATTFMVVTSPEPDPAREAVFLAGKLEEAGMARGGLIVNRVQAHGLDGRPPAEVAALLTPELGERLAERVASNLEDFDVLAKRDATTIAMLRGELHERAPVLVPQLDEDVQDLAGLARVAERLFV
jgi:anion-transporting  ArsA/GET3 family ATPase